MTEPRDPSMVPTPEQFLAELDALPPDARVEQSARIVEVMQEVGRCYTQQHDARLGNLRPLDTLRSNTTIACPDCSQPVQVPLCIAPERTGANIELRISVPQDAATHVFAEHVRSAMERHPTFAIRDDSEVS